jgi:hypothetical protein
MLYFNTRVGGLTVFRVCVDFPHHLLCVIYMSLGETFRCDDDT